MKDVVRRPKLGYSCQGLCYTDIRAWLRGGGAPRAVLLRFGVRAPCGQLSISYEFTLTENMGVSWELVGH